MPFPQTPYYVHVSAVTYNSSQVSGAEIKLKNLTKGTETGWLTSSETNSNITINLAECGDWTINVDNIQVEARYNTDTATSAEHTIVSADNSEWDAGTIAIVSAGGAATGLRITSTHTPSSSSDTGTQGQFGVDENYLYYCYATDSWKRTAWEVF